MSGTAWRRIALAGGLTGVGLAAAWPGGLAVPGLAGVLEARYLLWGGLLCLIFAVWGRGG